MRGNKTMRRRRTGERKGGEQRGERSGAGWCSWFILMVSFKHSHGVGGINVLRSKKVKVSHDDSGHLTEYSDYTWWISNPKSWSEPAALSSILMFISTRTKQEVDEFVLKNLKVQQFHLFFHVLFTRVFHLLISWKRWRDGKQPNNSTQSVLHARLCDTFVTHLYIMDRTPTASWWCMLSLSM